MTEAQRARYEAAYYKLLGEVTTLDAMIAASGSGYAADDVKLAYELEDLGRRLNALTAVCGGYSSLTAVCRWPVAPSQPASLIL
jgi:D-arabinose 5-phosphate isomerase GutQ